MPPDNVDIVPLNRDMSHLVTMSRHMSIYSDAEAEADAEEEKKTNLCDPTSKKADKPEPTLPESKSNKTPYRLTNIAQTPYYRRKMTPEAPNTAKGYRR